MKQRQSLSLPPKLFSHHLRLGTCLGFHKCTSQTSRSVCSFEKHSLRSHSKCSATVKLWVHDSAGALVFAGKENNSPTTPMCIFCYVRVKKPDANQGVGRNHHQKPEADQNQKADKQTKPEGQAKILNEQRASFTESQYNWHTGSSAQKYDQRSDGESKQRVRLYTEGI